MAGNRTKIIVVHYRHAACGRGSSPFHRPAETVDRKMVTCRKCQQIILKRDDVAFVHSNCNRG